MEKQKTDLPDFMSYKDKFTQSGFIEKISKIAKRAGAKLVYAALILYYTLQSYLISPLDVIPDAIPIAGLGDDLGVLLYVLRKVWTDIPEDVKTKAHDKLSKWFDEEEVKEADSINL